MNDTFETLSQHGITYVRAFENGDVIGEWCSVADDCLPAIWVPVIEYVPLAFTPAVPEPAAWLALMLGVFAVYARGLLASNNQRKP